LAVEITPEGQSFFGGVFTELAGWAEKGANKVGEFIGGNTITDGSLGQSKYDFTSRVFPDNIGTSFNRHYMIININVNDYSTQKSGAIQGPDGTIKTYERLEGESSKVDVLRAQIDKTYSSNGNELGRGGLFTPRHTTRIAESICLFMPNTVSFTHNNGYTDISLTEVLASAGSSIVNAMSSTVGRIGRTVSSLADTATALAGTPINPRSEVIFSNTSLRQFQYDFLFAPSTEKESETLEQIIKTLRYHAAPEMNAFGNGNSVLSALQGFLWTPPSEFDITFYHNGVENTKIPRINTCVMERCDVDYAPRGIYSTFSNGHPVAIRMILSFREVEVTSKLRILQGF